MPIVVVRGVMNMGAGRTQGGKRLADFGMPLRIRSRHRGRFGHGCGVCRGN
jgi:hypothetical protein